MLLVVLAALWAAVLIPATVSNRTAAHDDRSINGFSTAMRTLSRRQQPVSSPGNRRILVPTATVTDTRKRDAERMRMRRRRLLTRLLWTAGATFLMAVTLRGPWPYIHAVTDLALVSVVVHLRRLALAEQARVRADRRARLAERAAAERQEYLASEARRRAEALRAAIADSEQRLQRRRAVGD